ncbi:MAG: rhomboid family intramembrane serine protease [Planctomycetales bacterium]|nr:rhomboid family intramembrane serine protease [Planctomycetales bacterium]
MRQIGYLSSMALAQQFSDYMLAAGFDTHIEEEDGVWSVWAIDEEKLEQATEALAAFQRNPEDPRFHGHGKQASKIRSDRHAKNQQAKRNYRDGRQLWSGAAGGTSKAPITMLLIVASIGVSLWTSMGADKTRTDPIGFVSYRHMRTKADLSDPEVALTDIRQGQVWRLVTPIFLHLGMMHLLFNMMMMYQLGGIVEFRKGKLKYIAIVLVLAVISGLVQALIWRQPFFGGMSGVLYGLFGYVWMKSKFDPADGFRIPSETVTMLLVWFVICFLPSMNVANGGHTGGLVAGAAIGYLSAMMR